MLQSEESLAIFEWKWVWAKDRIVCSVNDKKFQPKSSIFDLPQFVAFIMFDILQTEEPSIGVGTCYSSDCRKSKKIPHIVCFLPYLDPTIWGILSRFENQEFLRLQVLERIPQFVGFILYWILQSEEFGLKGVSSSDWRLSFKFPTLKLFKLIKSYNLRNPWLILRENEYEQKTG